MSVLGNENYPDPARLQFVDIGSGGARTLDIGHWTSLRDFGLLYRTAFTKSASNPYAVLCKFGRCDVMVKPGIMSNSK